MSNGSPENERQLYSKPYLGNKVPKWPRNPKFYLVYVIVEAFQTDDSRDNQVKCNIANVRLNENNIRVAKLFVINPESQVCCIPEGLRGFWVGVWRRPLYHTYALYTGDVGSYHIAHLLTCVISCPLLQPTCSSSSMQRSSENIDCWDRHNDITHSLEYNVYTNPEPQDSIWSFTKL